MAFGWGNLQERDHSEHLGTDVKQYYNYLKEIGLELGGGGKDRIDWLRIETGGRLLLV
jgi:hypothetical protein